MMVLPNILSYDRTTTPTAASPSTTPTACAGPGSATARSPRPASTPRRPAGRVPLPRPAQPLHTYRTSRLPAMPGSTSLALRGAGFVEAQPVGSIGGLDDREAASVLNRADGRSRSASTPRRPSRHAATRARYVRAVAGARRWRTSRRRPRARRRRTGPRNPGPTAVLSADSPAGSIAGRTFEITFPAPGVDAYVFTFGEAAYSTSSAGRYEQPERPHRMMRGGCGRRGPARPRRARCRR